MTDETNSLLGALVVRLLDEVLIENRKRFDHIVKLLTNLETTMSAQIDALTAAVKKISDAEDSAIALLKGLATQLAACKTEPAAVQALADEINAKADNLAAAVVENTPAANP